MALRPRLRADARLHVERRCPANRGRARRRGRHRASSGSGGPLGSSARLLGRGADYRTEVGELRTDARRPPGVTRRARAGPQNRSDGPLASADGHPQLTHGSPAGCPSGTPTRGRRRGGGAPGRRSARPPRRRASRLRPCSARHAPCAAGARSATIASNVATNRARRSSSSRPEPRRGLRHELADPRHRAAPAWRRRRSSRGSVRRSGSAPSASAPTELAPPPALRPDLPRGRDRHGAPGRGPRASSS